MSNICEFLLRISSRWKSLDAVLTIFKENISKCYITARKSIPAGAAKQ